MKTITVRGVADDVYLTLVEWSRKNNRSLQEQVRHLLDQEVRMSRCSCLERAKNWRRKLRDRDLGDTVAQIREDRER